MTVKNVGAQENLEQSEYRLNFCPRIFQRQAASQLDGTVIASNEVSYTCTLTQRLLGISTSATPVARNVTCFVLLDPSAIMSSIAMTEKSINERRPSEITLDSESGKLKHYEGGRAAWCTVAGSALVYYASFGIMNSFGFFQDYYTREFLPDTPAMTIAFCGTLQMFLMNSLAAVSGALCDRYGVKVRLHSAHHEFS